MSRKLRALILTVALVSILVVGLVSTAFAAPPTSTCSGKDGAWVETVYNVLPRDVHTYEQGGMYVCVKN